MPAGRPPIWDDPEAFDKSVEEYFANKEEVHTWTGLALHLGFESRKSLWEYGEKPQFSNSVKKALIRIESKYEQHLFKGKNPSGAIFALKNFGWTDRQEIKHEVSQGFLNIDPLSDAPADNSTKENSGA